MESAASGIGDRGFHLACWYQRDFTMQADGQRVLLHFGAVDYRALVWVNDTRVISHEGGHTPFSVDITRVLHASGKQVVTVFVEGAPQNDEAAWQTGLATRTTLHLVSTHHRNLADGVA